MKPPLRLLLAVFIVGLIVALAFFGWSAKAKSDATFHLANGVEVTPVEVKRDDVAQLLDAKIWKFNVHLPDPNKAYDYTLVLLQHGQPTRWLGGFGTTPDSDEEGRVAIGMVPIGDDFDKAQRIKYTFGVINCGTQGTFANPFKHEEAYISDTPMSFQEQKYLRPELGGQVFLIDGHKDDATHSDVNDTYIALQIEPVVVQPPNKH